MIFKSTTEASQVDNSEMRSQPPLFTEKTSVGSRSYDAVYGEGKASLDDFFNTTNVLDAMLERYQQNGRAQNVSFRELVSWMKVGERATHYLHSYPAKLLPQIASFFLSSSHLSNPGDFVLDPFGGSGTVALEALISGRNAYYSDVNPLAQLIAKVKTTPIEPLQLEKKLRLLLADISVIDISSEDIPSVVNLEYWYSKTAIEVLAKIRKSVEKIRNRNLKRFFLVCLSATCRKVSFSDPRLSVPVRLKDLSSIENLSAVEIIKIFELQSKNNIKRMREFLRLIPSAYSSQTAKFVGNDARMLREPSENLGAVKKRLLPDSVSLIITSPPYAGAQKYIRASGLSLGWLGLASADGLKPLENASIGREHFLKSVSDEYVSTGYPKVDKIVKKVFEINPLRSKIIGTYIKEMDVAISEMERVLKPGGHIVIVVGNNEVCGMPFKSSDYLVDIAKRYGLTVRLRLVDEIKSRGLMTKRNRSASIITREWVLLFAKNV